MKKVLILMLAVLLISSSVVFAAGSSEQEDDVFKVAYIARAQGDSFASWLANSIQQEMDKYPDMEVDIMDGQASDEKVNSFIENSITNQYDLIILQPNNGEAQTPYVLQVVAAGIPIILTNPRIPDLMGTTYSVDADPYEQGAVNARYAVDLVPQNAKVVVLNGPAGNMHSTARELAWDKEFFAKRPDVTIVGEQIAHWNKDEAMSFMEDWVQANDKIDAVISMNDNMAAGALEVVKDNPKYDDLLVFGVDGTAEAALLIEEGRLTSTSFQNAYELAIKNAKLAHDILTGEVTDLVDTDIDCPLITKENVELLMDAHRATGAIQ
ncbi:MAG: sugar ABC transporter substrate-binding protein [Sphaerochaetaceae bacterium]|nr:sugar ABC transporter substrate-binding protein [Sphaerochaetaceae bacterium]MDC7248008.1 sugar ABC transporter substrate-binding protein [Sphaerochaetaceae bacterium]